MSDVKYFSMFSGIGGFELGIQRAFEAQTERTRQESSESLRSGSAQGQTEGHEGLDSSTATMVKHTVELRDRQPYCVGYSEIDKYAIKVYERQFSGHKNFGDATAINPTKLPDFDLLVGGFPCQAFSIAGKRAGFDDTRGTLFFDIARILKEKQPRHLVLENVKGLLSHDSGRTFTTIIGVLTDLGYSVEWQVLNSKDFGVPQNRERVYIVGHLGNECGRKVFPIRQDGVSVNERFKQGVQQTANTLRARDYASWRGNHVRQLNQPTHSNDRVYSDEGISPTLNTMQGGNRQPFIAAQRGRENGQVLEPQLEDKSNTLTAVAKDNYVVDVPRIRRLTPLECERLQGFPDNWTKEGIEDLGYQYLIGGKLVEISDTQRYKMCGNAVTVNTVQAVIERLISCLK